MGKLLYRSAALSAAISDATKAHSYDWCLILGDVCMASYAKHVAKGMPIIWDICDNLGLGYHRRAAVINGLRSAYYEAQANRIERYVRKVSPRFDVILVIADKDADSLRGYFDGPIIIVPNAWNVDHFTENLHRDHDTPKQLLFTGAMQSWANRDAVDFFVRSIFPLIRRSKTPVTFDVVGAGADSLNLGSKAGVRLTGFVDSLAPYYATCDVFVCPLRTGTGTKNKIVEAMASGCAVVTTSTGAEGLSINNGVEAIIADTPHDFAVAVTTLLNSAELRRKLGAQARSLVRRDFSNEVTADRLFRALDQARQQVLL